MSSTGALRVVEAAIAAADAGDRARCEAAMHPDLSVTLAGVPTPVDRESWLEGVLEMSSAFPDLRTVVLDAVVDDDRVAIRSVITGTHRGDFTGIPATGRRIEVASHDFYRIDGGRVVEAWIVTDTATLFGQLS